jgi:transcriptional regulator with XRE-family HTH domain
MSRIVVNKPQPLDAATKRELERLLSAFGVRLRSLRHDRLLTIEQVAEAAGLHPNYVGAVERGERNVSLFNIWRIASGLGVPAAAVMEELPVRKAKPAARKDVTW